MAGNETLVNGASFWARSTDTHKADGDYYELVAEALERLVVPELTADQTLLDFGCGNGEFTRLLAQHCSQATGIDVSAPLIAQANAADACAPGTRFLVGTEPPPDSFDVVSCMGVLVCLVTDDDFDGLLRALARCVEPGGMLILRETLSWGDAQLQQHDDYVAHYRTPLDHLRPLAEEGIQLVHDEHLATWSEQQERSNHLWILRRP